MPRQAVAGGAAAAISGRIWAPRAMEGAAATENGGEGDGGYVVVMAAEVAEGEAGPAASADRGDLAAPAHDAAAPAGSADAPASAVTVAVTAAVAEDEAAAVAPAKAPAKVSPASAFARAARGVV